MSKDTSTYQSPLAGRYASPEMLHLFSADKKFSTWRKLWVALAEAERRLGIDISEEQIAELKRYVDIINYDVADAQERKVKHDVMAHVYAYGQQCPQAAGIIHLGATSCYVTDNTDILIIRGGLNIVKRKVLRVIENLADFADKYKDVPILGMTHGQPATPTTVGKRAALWLQNFMENIAELEFVESRVKLLGCRGATGTSETFMKLFDGDEEKVRTLDRLIVSELERSYEYGTQESVCNHKVWPVSGQTYPRNFDIQVMNCLANIAASAYKMANDIRLSQHDKELEEPFDKTQIGSSAMPYKRNPMRCERICSLSRYVQNEARNAYDTANVQWWERTLDDSANRRLSLPACFLGIDAVLIISANVTDGLVVNKAVIDKRLREELPFMVVEPILMHMVEKGADRQESHEFLRQYAMEAGQAVKQQGKDNPLIDLILDDREFRKLITREEIDALMNPQNLIGRCVGQVNEYLLQEVQPLLARYRTLRQERFDTDLKV